MQSATSERDDLLRNLKMEHRNAYNALIELKRERGLGFHSVVLAADVQERVGARNLQTVQRHLGALRDLGLVQYGPKTGWDILL